jgi:uncharacterized protein
MFIRRVEQNRFQSILRQFPIVAILGARQVGKSTFARHSSASFEVLDLENPSDLLRLQQDPVFVLEQSQKIIIDEAQRMPELFSVLRNFIDEHPKHKIVILGSASPTLLHQVSESLTGRVAFLEMGTVSVFEQKQELIWLKGGFPRVHWGSPKPKPYEWYSSYLRTYLEQDIPQLGFRLSSIKMRQLMTMVAHGQGGISNLSELGGSLGINYHSVSHILDVFSGTFLLRKLPPYFANVGKRLVKSPKLYLRDTGLLHFLLGIDFTKKALLSHPKAGASFETFCIEQILHHALLVDPSAQGFFYRTSAGAEIDLLLQLKGKLIPIEIKMSSSSTVPPGMINAMKDLGLRKGFILNFSKKPLELRAGILQCDLMFLLKELGIAPKI